MNLIEKLLISIHCKTLAEADILPPKYATGLNRLREELPQFDSIEDVDSFASFCKSTGTRVSKKVRKAYELNPSQNHVDSDKIIDIVQNYAQSSPPVIQPIVIDKDGYIIDGHHRWAALMYMNPNMEIPVYQFNVKVNRLLRNKVPRWQDTIGDTVVESFDGDITDSAGMFEGIKTGVLNAVKKEAKLFSVKQIEGKKLVVLDRNGNTFIQLLVVSSTKVALSVFFPGSSTGEPKVFNHWNPSYGLRILKNILDVVAELKQYWDDPQLADMNRAEIAKIRKQYRTAMSKF